MNNLFRGLLAGYGAKKLGGGCFSTILIFVIIWVVLGQCSSTFKSNASEEKTTNQTEIKESGFVTSSAPAIR
ncbi:hypothetical protein [Pontibacter virosus]|uniref:Uncharacterized protein n=1 Tax=Pontibacter virosus TaxID=1765052 RepID=A0A2U1ALS1_9BACT|nr:hypothetical protein [Pontibacter virosus]PVY37358.1 hypothetical protein C8E01_12149 [Pontibacter virosus]